MNHYFCDKKPHLLNTINAASTPLTTDCDTDIEYASGPVEQRLEKTYLHFNFNIYEICGCAKVMMQLQYSKHFYQCLHNTSPRQYEPVLCMC